MNSEFETWLKTNKHLRFYAPDEIASVALRCGWELKEVCAGINDHVARIKRMMVFWESPLSEKWMRAQTYEHGTDQ